MQTAYPTKLSTFTFVLVLFLLSAITAFSQPIIELGVDAQPVCSIDDTYCATLKIKLQDSANPADNSAQIGTSGIMVLYNLSALSFSSYTSHNFDENNVCLPEAPTANAWAPHGYSGDVPGRVNIVVQLASLEAFSCPTITNTEWIDIGTICFDILDANANVQIGYSNDEDLTNFNMNIPNNGTVGVAVNYSTLGNIQGPAVLEGITSPLITNGGEAELCQTGTGSPTSTTLNLTTVTPTPSGFTPQWQRDGVNISGENGTSLTVSQEGNYTLYFVSNSDPTCASESSNGINISVSNCNISTGECPIINPSYQVQNFCVGSFDLNEELTLWQNTISISSDPTNSAGDLVISGAPVSFINFPTTPPTGIYDGDGCNVNIQNWYAGYECDTNGDGIPDSYIDAGTFTINLYPLPQVPTITQSFDSNAEVCNYTINTACLGDSFTSSPTNLDLNCDPQDTNVSVSVTNGQGCVETFELTRPPCVSCGLPDCQLDPYNYIYSDCAADGTYTLEIEYNYNPNYTGSLLYIYNNVTSDYVATFEMGDEVIIGPFLADGSTVSYMMYNTGLSACNVSTDTIDAPICGGCGNENIQVIENINICSGDVLDLNSLFSQGGSGTSWTPLNGGPLSGSNVNGNNQSCTEVIYQYQGVFNDQSGLCPVNYTYYANVYIYPSSTVNLISSNECAASVSVGCTGYNVTWSDSQGNTGTGFNYQANEGSTGTVTFVSANPNFADCTESLSLTYNCPGACTTLTESAEELTSVCSGTTLNLNNFLPNTNYSGLAWTNNAGANIPSPTAWAMTNNTCNVGNQYYTATYQTQNAQGCTVDHTFLLTVEIYPQPQLSILSMDGCAPSVSSNCSNFNISWATNGMNGTGSSYQVTEGTSGSITFTATSAENSNCSNSISFNYDCPISCPTTTQSAQDSETICSGTTLNLNNYLPTNNYSNLEWTNTVGVVIDNPTERGFINNTCNISNRNITATYQTTSADNCTIDHSFLLVVEVYPTSELTMVASENCMAEVSVNCPNDFSITWADNQGNTGTGNIYEASTGNAGQVTFSSSNPNNATCQDDMTIAYNCEATCETISESSTTNGEICAGGTLNLNDFIETSGIANLEWKDASGNTITTPNSFSFANTNCTTATETFIATYQTAEINTGCPIDNELILSVAVYPQPEISLLDSDNCSVSVSINCSNFDINWTDTNGNSGTGDQYEADNGTIGQVTFTANSDNANCENSSFTYAFSCDLSCEPISQNEQASESICSGSTLNLSDYIGSSNYTNLVWTNESNGTINNPESILIENNACETLTRVFTATYQTLEAATNCPIDHTFTLSIEVYTAPELSLSSAESCLIEINTNCSNLNVTWTDTEGNNGSGTTYQVNEGSIGQVTFTSTGGNCEQAEFTYAYNCPVDCEEINVSDQSFVSFCTGTTFNLTDQILQGNYTNLAWTDEAGNQVNNTNITVENTDCDSHTELYTASFNSIDEDSGCPVNNTFTLSVEVAPIPNLSLVSNENCIVTVEVDCPNLEVNWQDTQGNSGNGMTYEANNTAGSVNFTVSNNFGVLCSDQLFISYSCDEPCQNTTVTLESVNLSICSETSLNLNSQISAAIGTNVSWKNALNQNINNSSNYEASNNSCTPLTETLTASWSEVDATNCTTTYYQTLTLLVYTQIEFTSQTEECLISVSTNCASAINITWEDNHNNQGTGATYEANNDVGLVNFLASWNNAPSICQDFIAVPYSCTDSPNTNPVGQTDLEINIEVGNEVESYNIGDWVYWVVTLENTSAVTANDVLASVPLPNGIEYLTYAGDGSYDETSGIWTLGTVPPFTIRTLVIYAFINESGIILTTAEVETANEPDSDSTPGNSNPSEDDYNETQFEVGAEGPQPEGYCDADVTTCTQEFTSIEICFDFCGPDMVIDDIESPLQCNVTQISPMCIRYLPYPSFDGTHEITITACNNSGNCETAIATIDVDNDCEINARMETPIDCEVEIPNIITPNNDGINDYFVAPSLHDCYANYEMDLIIFDSWGQTILEENKSVAYGSEVLWEDANEYQVGTYFYMLKLNDGDNHRTFSGFIEVRK